MWRLLDLGAVDGYTMTNLYEAVGKEVGDGFSPNTVILNHPISPFVNIGYHQLIEKEINIDYARRRRFPLVRRTIGGGAILDGPWEQDYFVVINRRSPECPPTIPEFYERFTKPAIYALRKFGLDAQLRKPNDLTVGGKKISGNGAITIGQANVLAGDLLIQTPADLMSEIINAPSEKFRDKLFDSMSQWLTSLEKEMSRTPTREEVKAYLVEGFEAELGTSLSPSQLTVQEEANLRDLVEERSKHEWIYSKDDELRSMMPVDVKGTKIREGVAVLESIHKAGKLVRVTLVLREGKISGISISGDFFTQPFLGAIDKLEERLNGLPLEEEPIRRAVTVFFEQSGVRMMGVTPDDLVTAILKTKPS